MKRYTLKQKRDGQGWLVTGSFYRKNWQEAKKEFTNSIRNDCANYQDYIYIDNEETFFNYFDSLNFNYEGPGYYSLDGEQTVLDNEILSCYKYDVYSYTINRV